MLITAHDAFGYFGRRYGFEVRGIQGASTATEAGARDVQNAGRPHRRAADPGDLRRVVRAAADGRGAAGGGASRGFDVRIGGQLFSDAMGDRGTPEGTYIGMVPGQRRRPSSMPCSARRLTSETMTAGDRGLRPDRRLPRPPGAVGRRPDGAAGRADGDRRAERRRQDDADQGDPRPAEAGGRAGTDSRQAVRGAAAARSATCRSGAASTGISRPACSTW